MSSPDKDVPGGAMSGGDKNITHAESDSSSAGGKVEKGIKPGSAPSGGKVVKSGSPSVGGKAVKAIRAIKGDSSSASGKSLKAGKGGPSSAGGIVAKDDSMPAKEGDSDMRPDEIGFLLECIRNPIGAGVITVDVNAVANARNYTNTHSVTNRITRLKNKYNLPITASTPSGRKSVASLKAPPKTPTTPSKNKVTKPQNTRSRAVKVKKNVKTAAFGDDESSSEEKTLDSNAKGKTAGDMGATSESGSDLDGKVAEMGFEDMEMDEEEDDGLIESEEEHDAQDEV